jgi:hypothetical protein
MTNPTDRSMAKATELTRSGKLQEATAMIRSLLQRPAKTAEPADPDPTAAGETIEGSFARVDPPTAEPSPRHCQIAANALG